MYDRSPIDEVVEALDRAGVPAVRQGDSLVIDGVSRSTDVRSMAVVTPAVAAGLRRPPDDVLAIVVADRISEDARNELTANGWAWVDRRGHLRLWEPPLRISAPFAPLRAAAPTERFSSVFPPVGIEVALALLCEPEREWTVTNLASSLGRSAGGVSERLRALRAAGLVDRRNRPIVPDLFWELVGPWHHAPTALGSFPGLEGPFHQLSWLGLPSDWVLTDTQAALALGAPLIASQDDPPDFYVPQPSIVDAAVSHFGPARGTAAAAVRPIRAHGIHIEPAFRHTASGLRIAHPVIVALDLAHDRARGRDVVEAWDPSPLGVRRVW